MSACFWLRAVWRPLIEYTAGIYLTRSVANERGGLMGCGMDCLDG